MPRLVRLPSIVGFGHRSVCVAAQLLPQDPIIEQNPLVNTKNRQINDLTNKLLSNLNRLILDKALQAAGAVHKEPAFHVASWFADCFDAMASNLRAIASHLRAMSCRDLTFQNG